ncbi:MAG: hypothetical protein HKN10_02620, partial [Myxococcales bacterium]|nr:hypothetical protein [Myxococcales bacterium]
LCAGGFVFNREMVAEHLPEFVPGLPLGTAGDDGLGIRLGQSVGGKPAQMHRASAWRFLYPPNAFAQGVLVNDKGERFANEFWYGAKIGEAMVEENHGVATLIIDEKLKKLARAQSKPGELQWFQRAAALMNLYLNCKKAEDLDALAEMLDVPRATLQKTLDENNAVARDSEGPLRQSARQCAPAERRSVLRDRLLARFEAPPLRGDDARRARG